MSDPLTHFDESGAARMVKITAKEETPRLAVARARVRMEAETLARIRGGEVGKGDVLGVARLGGITGAKQTANAIPLCHPVRVTGVDISFELDAALPGVRVQAEVHAHDRTGPDMEAMNAAAAAALTIYDMCKAMDRSMCIEAIELVEKAGGKSGHWNREG
jgi:cyclic pyranopterin phosphate synthase